jgi:hypothetical protein
MVSKLKQTKSLYQLLGCGPLDDSNSGQKRATVFQMVTVRRNQFLFLLVLLQCCTNLELSVPGEADGTACAVVKLTESLVVSEIKQNIIHHTSSLIFSGLATAQVVDLLPML